MKTDRFRHRFALNDKEAVAGQRQVGGNTGVHQCALAEDLLGSHDAHAHAFLVFPACRDVTEHVLELGARRSESNGVGADVVTDDSEGAGFREKAGPPVCMVLTTDMIPPESVTQPALLSVSVALCSDELFSWSVGASFAVVGAG